MFPENIQLLKSGILIIFSENGKRVWRSAESVAKFAKFQISLKLPELNEVLIIQFIFIHFFNSLVKWRLESRGGVAPDAASGHGDV